MTIEALFIKSWELAKHRPKWWGLAFLQAVSLGWLLKFSKVSLFFSPENLGTILLLVLILSSATVFLWADILAKNDPKSSYFKTGIKLKFTQIAQLAIVFFIGIFMAAVFRVILPYWVLFAPFASLLFVSVFVCALFCVVFHLSLSKALALAVDFWKKQSGVLCGAAFMLIVGHGFSFAAARSQNSYIWAGKGFSFLAVSATIWLLLFVCCLFCGVLTAVLNVFVVLGFVNIVKGKPTTEVVLENRNLAAAADF